MGVAVFGSLNMDMVFRCKAIPKPGETVLCEAQELGAGGKGLNQAIAARRAGGAVSMAGAVGNDSHGKTLLNFLSAEGVRCDNVQHLDGVATGLAHIVVDGAGENAIVVASGANSEIAAWSGDDLAGQVCLAQLEVPLAAVASFLEAGREQGSICILNAAPAVSGASGLFALCDVIVVNEHELAEITGASIDPFNLATIAEAAGMVAALDTQTVVVTLGAHGTHVVGAAGNQFVAATKVKPLDTTGAGDCFCGVLADGLARGLTIIDAVARASAAAAIAVTRPGAAQAMPTEIEIGLAMTA